MTNVRQTSGRTFAAQTAPYRSSWHWNGLSEYNFVIPGACSGSVWVCACAPWPPLSLPCSYPSISPQNPFTILRVHCKLYLQFGKHEWNAIVYSDIVRNPFYFFSPQSCKPLHTILMKASERHALLDSLLGDREQQSCGKSISETVSEIETGLTASLLFPFAFFF